MIALRVFAIVLLLAATLFHLLAAFGVASRVGWSELAWSCATGAALTLLI